MAERREQRGDVRLAVLEQKVQGLVDDVAELNLIRKEDHHRLRNVEGSVKMMLEAQELGREAERRQYARLVLWLQVAAGLGALVAAAVALLALVLSHA